MKRTLLLLFFLTLPLSLWAMTPVADSELSMVTGQAGVNINADLTMNIGIGTMAWGDEDGLEANPYNPWSTDSAGGFVGVENFTLSNLFIKARTADTYNGYNAFSTTTTNRLKPVTIDVGTGGPYPAGVTYVRIGLGSLQVSIGDMTTVGQMRMTLGLADRTGFAGDLDQELGDIFLRTLLVYISPYSYVDIYNARVAGSQGVTMTFNVQVDYLRIGVLSWGDTDGLGAGVRNIWYGTTADTTQGWIGLQNVQCGPITVTGTVGIDVATVSGGVYGASALVSAVRMDFDNFHVNVTGPVTGQVRIGNIFALNTTTTMTMGNFYLSQFDLNVDGWVDIWAH